MIIDIIMGIILMTELKTKHCLCKLHIIIVCLILSPFAPLIIHYLRKFHFGLTGELASFNLKHKAPKFGKEYENETNMDLSRWLRIQQYRHKGYAYFTYLLTLLWAMQFPMIVIMNEGQLNFGARFVGFMLGVTVIISIFLLAMVNQSRPCLFTQSYWFNVL